MKCARCGAPMGEREPEDFARVFLIVALLFAGGFLALSLRDNMPTDNGYSASFGSGYEVQ